MPGNQRTRLVPLPHPGGHRVLMIFGGYPPVEREPQSAAARRRNRAAPEALRPREQQISTRTIAAEQTRMLHRHDDSPLPCHTEAWHSRPRRRA
jgi:hypothetical protein